ncbi:MAG: Cof-type HAD-IIB family hydrolase [Eubacteriales bacterium]
MPKFRLIAADLDGTLLDDTYRVMPELLSSINEGRAKGVELVVATGRLYPSALPFVRDLAVCLPVIASNGAVVRDPGTGELICHLPLARDLAVEALMLTGGGSAQRFVNIRDNFYTDAPEETSKRYSEALRINFITRVPLEEVVTEDPTMVVIRDGDAEICRLTGILREHFGEKVYLANSKPFFIDINHPAVSKGTALVNLCERLGISLQEVIAVGDGWNDLEMLGVAGLGAAVANAPEELKASADYVCNNQSYKGVIEIIERFL